jgi:hypothetical protein
MLQGSPLLAYETPVLGPPWSIPLEFPVYQAGVAVWSKVTGAPLDQSGRMVSLTFCYACLLPVFWLQRRLELPAACFVCFAILYLTSPLYLFWSRAFLIESTALAFSFGYLAVCWVVLQGGGRRRLLWWAASLGSAAALVKVTTFAAAMAAIGILCALAWMRKRPRLTHAVQWLLATVAVPVGAEMWWVRFSDAVKVRNPLQFLTSDELAKWNFGELGFRFSAEFWSTVANRMGHHLFGKGWLVVLVVGVALWSRQRKEVREWAAIMAASFWCVTLTFANLHYVHDYYQCGSAAYLFLGFAIVCGAAWNRGKVQRAGCAVLLAVLVAGNAWVYRVRYYPSLLTNNAYFKTAKYLKATTAQADVILGYGLDWDPTIAYYGERRMIMDRQYRPIASAQMQEALAGLRAGQKVTAVVGCEQARMGWCLERVWETVRALGWNSGPVLDDGRCQVYTGEPRGAGDVGKAAVDGQNRRLWLNYLKASGRTRCLLVNFQKPKVEWKRIVLGFQPAESADPPTLARNDLQ